jgi:hypothetical protein
MAMKWKAFLKSPDWGAVRQPLGSTEAPSGSHRDDKCGIHQLYPGPDDTNMASTGPDKVAVHGLNGDPFTTWTHENGKIWLSDFLPTLLPRGQVVQW